MATKNNAKALVGNLGIGRTRNTELNNEPAEGNAVAKRPSVEAGCKAGDARTTIILNKELIKKIKFIALAEGSSIKDKVTESLVATVDAWESANGKIPLK